MASNWLCPISRMKLGKLFLAPVQGITDPIFRDLLTRLGGIDGCVSVFSRVSILPLPTRTLLRQCPEMGHAGRTRAGAVVHLQLLGANPELLAETARRGAAGGAPAIDLNFGCPMGRVNRHDGGAALLRNPQRISRIIKVVRGALPSTVPISAKVRIGWSNPNDAPIIAKAVEDGGASWMTMHGRTREQVYDGRADWEAIGRARQAVQIPVIANGDIRNRVDLHNCASTTGCQHFMVGRGALARPEVFRLLSGQQDTWWPPVKRLELLLQYGDQCNAVPTIDNTAGRVKAWWRYLASADQGIADAFVRSRRCPMWPELRGALTQSIRFLRKSTA